MLRTQLALFFCAVIALASSVGGRLEVPRVDPDVELIMTAQDPERSGRSGGAFFKNLPSGFEMPTEATGELLLREYGSVFVAKGGVKAPTKVIFENEREVTDFQASLAAASQSIGGILVELQKPAMKALEEARKEAAKQGLSVSPRSSDSSRRDYEHTVDLWASRVNPGLAHWVAKGRMTKAEAARIKRLSAFEQVPVVLKLEESKIYFAKSLDKSIIYSVAPPGTSQHLSMLALDVKEFDNLAVRAILAKHGWYQTVTSDLPHFTYLGVREDKLPDLVLKRVINSNRVFWVPDID